MKKTDNAYMGAESENDPKNLPPSSFRDCGGDKHDEPANQRFLAQVTRYDQIRV
jgi:hypothetical protein